MTLVCRGILANLGQAFNGQVATLGAHLLQAMQRPEEQLDAQPADELTDPLVARLAGLVLAQGFLAAQVERQMAALHFRIGLQLDQDFAGDGRISANALVEADPGTLFLGLEAGAPGARTGFLYGHGIFSKDERREDLSPVGEAVDSPGLHGCAALLS